MNLESSPPCYLVDLFVLAVGQCALVTFGRFCRGCDVIEGPVMLLAPPEEVVIRWPEIGR